MSEASLDLKEFHWLMDMIQSVDVGLIVMDKNYQIKVWNSFMENHSNRSSDFVRSKVLFDIFPDTPLAWIRKKMDTSFLLKNRAFSTWEQRPYLFKFNNYRPITGTETFMYQNVSIIPLSSVNGDVNHVCLIIYDVTDIASQRKELHLVNAQLEQLSRTDAMTALNNRGHWEERLLSEYKRFGRDHNPRTLVIFDIDHFKLVNDTHGHQAGDEVIREVAKTLQYNQRETDISGRYGGEEFVIILTNISERSARIFSERLRKNIESLTIQYNNTEIKVTVSLGLAETNEEDENELAWLKRADTALCHAKDSGRNQSVLFSTIS